MIIAIDFDGTCVTHDYPQIGKDIGAVPVLRRLVAEGHKLLLWTVRDEEELDEAVSWFLANRIELWGINRNPEQRWSLSPKAYAHVYIDDRGLGVPLVHGKHPKPYVDWEKLEGML